MSIPEHMRHLPVHRGMPVPWVARWKGEILLKNNEYAYDLVMDKNPGWPRIKFVHGESSRTSFGVLWQREGKDRTGDPDFGAVNTRRHVDSMVAGLCQVCGSHLSGNWKFLMPEMEMVTMKVLRGTTATPPICDDCIEFSAKTCPFLSRRGNVAVEARAVEPAMVFGEVLEIKANGVYRTQTNISLTSPQKRSVLGKQLVVRLIDWKRIE